MSVSSLLLALIVALALGAGGTFYFWNLRRRQDEVTAGTRALAAMRWREFSHFVLDAMRHRGYDLLTVDDEAERGQQTEFMLSKNGQRFLLSCKHGAAYRLAAPAVAELAANIRFQGVSGGLLVTPGQIEPEARAPAAEAKITLIDGETLWPEVAPLLPQSLREASRHAADTHAKRQIGLTWAGAIVVGFALALLTGGSSDSQPEPKARPAATTATPAPVAPAAEASIAAPVTGIPANTPEEEEEQRIAVVRMLSSLPGIDRAMWSTKSTLLVNLDQDASDMLTEVCAVLERYDNLRTSRVQLQPPPGSTQRVRFRQCRTN